MAVAPFNWDDVVQWDGPGAIAGSEEILSADRLDRARYAEFLTNYLAAEGKQRNYVLNLNAEWGAGKTWFIKRWYVELKAHYPTVYIDAWQQDFSDDPLLTVISSIIDQLKMIAGKENPIPEGMRQRLLGLFKVGGKLALKAAIKKAGLEEDDFSLEGDDANQLVDALCSNQKERYESIQYLKQEIRQWVEGAVALGNGELDYPAFILIDELDRCRPSYAVEMLETIKHIFDIPRVVFVLATDTEQLQHAVKVIYGSEFDAYTYLSRFFNRRFSMLSCSRHDFVESHLSNASYLDSNIFETIWPRGLNVGSLNDIISAIADACQLSLRSTEKLIDRLQLVLVNIKDDSVNTVFLVYLIALHESMPSDYEAIITLVKKYLPSASSRVKEHKLHGINNIVGTVSIKMESCCNGAFAQGIYTVPISNLIVSHLQGYLGEYENISYQLEKEVEELKAAYPSITEKNLSERLKYYVLNSKLHDKSLVDMSTYRDWVELAISFE
ncbi:KAP family P-loop NTPase fold protein [Aeromonas veronii]|uniref:KAP family P-loop NTPase fold protein n=1 Tax=Aeromonas veronii TaxID=654 RepID=UPI00214DE779|nr:KAP family NTPase [Aeromonas veronii]MCR3965990.1 KAP family NTPase [Aeromonas veronii]MCR3978465.1 KAP family NTPase [Aeromonas veronii]